MKLVSYLADGLVRVGGLFDKAGVEYLIDLHQANPSLPSDMIAFLRMGDEALSQAEEVLCESEKYELIPLSKVRLGPPIPNPSKIICLGLNYQDHAPKEGSAAPAFPTFFAKYNNCLIGPGDPIILPAVTKQVDYEAELAVVIGKRGKNIPFDRAFDHVVGYTGFNDVSARDYQSRTSQWLQGKTFDTFGPMGPVLVTRDEIPHPDQLDIALVLNGQTMQHSNTAHLIFSIPQIIVYLSQFMTLEAGDVISTGTPGGVGALRTPPVFLKAGDQVKVVIEQIGELINPVING
jgi:2-keto-4-pentenoate hydratase/2-oxohepta-3-ene-1,7-dioic acid hydratase in catechol pathway